MFTLYCSCGYPFLVEKEECLSLWKGSTWDYSFIPNGAIDAVTHCPDCGKELKIEEMKSLGELELD